MEDCLNPFGMMFSVVRSIEVGVITAFAGGLGNIPPGWFLCDGTNGTPDLRNKFVVATGPIFSVDDSPPIAPHNHDFTGDGHSHSLRGLDEIRFEPDYNRDYSTEPAAGTTGAFAQAPPYYALAYIMFLGE